MSGSSRAERSPLRSRSRSRSRPSRTKATRRDASLISRNALSNEIIFRRAAGGVGCGCHGSLSVDGKFCLQASGELHCGRCYQHQHMLRAMPPYPPPPKHHRHHFTRGARNISVANRILAMQAPAGRQPPRSTTHLLDGCLPSRRFIRAFRLLRLRVSGPA